VRNPAYRRRLPGADLNVQVTAAGVRFDISNKKALAAHSFFTGAGIRFMVAMGITKCYATFYRWFYPRQPAFTDYQVG